jgi:D-alanyl-D-alanine dipeptidase
MTSNRSLMRIRSLRQSSRLRQLRSVSLAAIVLVGCAKTAPQPVASINAPAASTSLLPGPKPPAVAAQLVGLLGEYDAPTGVRVVLEAGGALHVADTVGNSIPFTQRSRDEFASDRASIERMLGIASDHITFVRAGDRATELVVADRKMARRNIEPAPGTNQLHVTPVRPVAELRTEALAASPPPEKGNFRPADLVELTRLDPTIHLEIRYATTNNFLGTKFYDEARAFMQRPAAEAVVRANKSLRPLGYGLLIHDAYRPWYVTKMFWDATPLDRRWLVANPAEGSKHNRGSAVDLTLFDLATGQPVPMPSTYDESTDRAHADYPGGTSLERWHRALLRRAMEAQGFAVIPTEWWHFDYSNWRDYGIGNVPFDKIPAK